MHNQCVRGISLFFQCFAFLQASDHLEPFEVAGGTAKPEPAISLSSHWHYTMYTLKILVSTISGSPQSWVLTTLLAITPKNGLTHTRPLPILGSTLPGFPQSWAQPIPQANS